MRLFVAVNLPAAERRAAYEATAPLRAARLPVKWVGQDSIHVTLRFLGEVEQERVAPIAEALAASVRPARPFGVALGGVGAFPTHTCASSPATSCASWRSRASATG